VCNGCPGPIWRNIFGKNNSPRPRAAWRLTHLTVLSMPIRFKTNFLAAAIGLLGIVLLLVSPLNAEIYRFRDENGNWRFADAPPGEAAGPVEVMAAVSDPGAQQTDLARLLEERFTPRSGVERATLATVTIHSTLGKGSGFFISDQGLLLTNRHVLTGDTRQVNEAAALFDQGEKQLAQQAAWLDAEERRLRQAWSNLEEMKAAAAGVTGEARRRQALAQYQERLAYYRSRQDEIARKRAIHKAQKDAFRQEQTLFKNKMAMAGIVRNFEVTTKDGQTMSAHLIRISADHDLALLKVEGYRTPWLEPADMGRMGQGSDVFAIGSPVSLHDSVSRGVLSGVEEGFIKTDAGIYPGNSGGPLVTSEGRVIGVNTFKLLTERFEGLGFAIPIQTALEEFKQEIGPGR